MTDPIKDQIRVWIRSYRQELAERLQGRLTHKAGSGAAPGGQQETSAVVGHEHVHQPAP